MTELELPVTHRNEVKTKFFTEGKEIPITWKMYDTGYTYRVRNGVSTFLSREDIQEGFTDRLCNEYNLTEEEKQLIRDANTYNLGGNTYLNSLRDLDAEEFLIRYRGLLTAYFQSGIHDSMYGTWKDADGTQFCNVLGKDITDKVPEGLKTIVPQEPFYGVIIGRDDQSIDFESLEFCALYSSSVIYKLYAIKEHDDTKYVIGVNYDSESG